MLTEGHERPVKVEPKIDRKLSGPPAIGQPRQRVQRLLEVRGRLVVRRVRERLRPCLATTLHLVPILAAKGVVGETFEMFCETIAVKPLDRGDDPGVECAPALVQQTAVGHVVGDAGPDTRETLARALAEVG